MPEIIINNIVIEFPDSGESPNWAPAVIQFAQAVESALNIAIGPSDVSPQAFNINAYNTASNVDIPNLSFSTSTVRAVFIDYAIFRTTDTTTAYEAGDIIGIYNPNNSVGQKWTISVGNKTGGDGQITFNMTDTGQIQFSSTAISGSNHAGKITFYAKALEQS